MVVTEAVRERAWLEVAGDRVDDGSRTGRWRVVVDDCGVCRVLAYCGTLRWPEVRRMAVEEAL